MTNSVADAPVTTLRSPADLVELVPFLLGFHPTDSLVVVELRQAQSRVGTVTRLDLAAAADTARLATGLAARLAGGGADGAVIIVYRSAEQPAGGHAPALLIAIGAALSAVGVPLCDALSVGGGRWRSYLCHDRLCCPPGGKPLPGGPDSTVAAAAAVAGLVALPDRQALERSLQPAAGAAASPMEDALRRTERAFLLAAIKREAPRAWQSATRERFRRAVHRADAAGRLDGPAPDWLPDREVARLVVGLVDVGARDACWRDLDLRCSADAFAVCWQLARRSLPPYRAAPLFLLGWAAWRRGDGALARVAALQALENDARYDAARLLLVVLDHGIDPGELPRLAVQPGGAWRPRRRR